MDKKSICSWLIILYFFFSPGTASCAESHWGIKAGVPFGFYTGASYQQYLDALNASQSDVTFSPSVGFGFSLGTYYIMGITDFFAIKAELDYTISYVDYLYVANRVDLANGSLSEKMQFLEMPLLVLFNVNTPGNHYRFNFFLGADVFFSSGDITLKNSADKKEIYTLNQPDAINQIFLNALAGAEWYMYFTKHWYYITECRFSWGLFNQRTESWLPDQGDWKMHLLTVNIGFGYKI